MYLLEIRYYKNGDIAKAYIKTTTIARGYIVKYYTCKGRLIGWADLSSLEAVVETIDKFHKIRLTK